MNVLITGIGGLLGGRLASWILDNVPEASVYGIDDWSCGYRENVRPNGPRIWTYEYTLGSGHRRSFVDQLFDRFRFERVFHLAAYAAEGLSPFIRGYNYRNNLLATAEIVNACLRHPPKRLVFTSSMAVYGPQKPPFDESMPYAPIDPYGVAKAAAEQDIRIAGGQHGLPWTVIRPHNVYGVGQDIWTPYRNVLGIWMARTLAGQPMRVYGDGSQVRAFSQITDCLPCLWRAATAPKTLWEIINLGGTRPISIGKAAELCRQVMGRGEIERHEPRHEVREAWSTWQQSVDLLGYEDRTPLRDGLAEMWAWARRAWEQFPERLDRPAMEYEVTRGMYSYWREVRRGKAGGSGGVVQSQSIDEPARVL